MKIRRLVIVCFSLCVVGNSGTVNGAERLMPAPNHLGAPASAGITVEAHALSKILGAPASLAAPNHLLLASAPVPGQPRVSDPRIDPHEPDYLQDFEVHQWPLAKMPVKIFITPDGERGFDAKLSQLIMKAFSQWVCVESSLRIVPVDEYTKADIIVERPAAYGELPAGMGGRTMYDYDTKSHADKPPVWRARTYLSATSSSASDLTPSAMDVFYTLALHEAGHALGLDGHSPDADDIMFAKTTNSQLSRHDLASICHVYPR